MNEPRGKTDTKCNTADKRIKTAEKKQETWTSVKCDAKHDGLGATLKIFLKMSFGFKYQFYKDIWMIQRKIHQNDLRRLVGVKATYIFEL